MISAIVPVFNGEKWIIRCLNSIANQKEEHEIIIIDDGSTDRTYNICAEWARGRTNVIVFSQENAGVAEARNKGIELAEGEWITFIDADDYLMDNAFSIIDRIPKECEVAICGFDSTIFPPRDHNGICNVYEATKLRQAILNLEPFFVMYPQERGLNGYNNYASWAHFFRRDIIVENQIHFPAGIKTSEDLVFNYHVYKNSSKVCIFDYIVYFYEMNPESVIHTFQKNLIQNDQRVFQTIQSILSVEDNALFYQFVVSCVFEWCRNYFINSQSGLSLRQGAVELAKQCKSDIVKEAINNCEPKLRVSGKIKTMYCRLFLRMAQKENYLLFLRLLFIMNCLIKKMRRLTRMIKDRGFRK